MKQPQLYDQWWPSAGGQRPCDLLLLGGVHGAADPLGGETSESRVTLVPAYLISGHPDLRAAGLGGGAASVDKEESTCSGTFVTPSLWQEFVDCGTIQNSQLLRQSFAIRGLSSRALSSLSL